MERNRSRRKDWWRYGSVNELEDNVIGREVVREFKKNLANTANILVHNVTQHRGVCLCYLMDGLHGYLEPVEAPCLW